MTGSPVYENASITWPWIEPACAGRARTGSEFCLRTQPETVTAAFSEPLISSWSRPLSPALIQVSQSCAPSSVVVCDHAGS